MIRIKGPFTRFIFTLLTIFQLGSISMFAVIIMATFISNIQSSFIKDVHLHYKDISYIFDQKISFLEDQIDEIANSKLLAQYMDEDADDKIKFFIKSKNVISEGCNLFIVNSGNGKMYAAKEGAGPQIEDIASMGREFPINRITFRPDANGVQTLSLIRKIRSENIFYGYAVLVYSPLEDHILSNKIHLRSNSKLYINTEEALYNLLENHSIPIPSSFAPLTATDFEYIRNLKGDHLFVRLQRFSNLYFRFSLAPLYDEKLRIASILILAAMVIFFLTLLVSLIIARIVAHPLLELSNQAKRMVYERDLPNLKLGNIRFSELVELSNTFNELLAERRQAEDNVKMINTELEKRVRVRTKELEKAKEIAEQASELKSQFVANVSHEIRTPLNAIIGFCEILTEEKNPTPDYIPMILHESENLLDLINDLLDLAKIESGKIVIKEEPFIIREIIETLTSRYIPKENVELQSYIEDSVPPVLIGDRLRISQILQNLLTNALKFTDEGHVKLSITTERLTKTTATLLFELQDTGIGIPKEKQEIIFNSFTQADGSHSRVYGGSGLGTTIAKDLIEAMGSTLALSSTSGVGSRFWFSISLSISDQDIETLHSNSEKKSINTADNDSTHILIAEDYLTNQMVAGYHLRSAGYNVSVVTNGEEAVKSCEETAFDLILMDLQMPVLDGFSAATQIRSGFGKNRDTVILAMTANAYTSARDACIAAGMNGIITKPIHKDDFLSQIYNWVHLKKQGKDSSKYKNAVIPDEKNKNEIIEKSNVSDYEEPVIDIEKGGVEFGSRDLFIDIVEAFIYDVESNISSLEAHINNRDTESVRLSSHKMKGGAYNVFAENLGDIFSRMEKGAKAGRWDDIDTGFEQLKTEFKRCKSFIGTRIQ